MAKGNPRQQNTFRTQNREDVHSALEWIREAARKNKEARFTALFHYVYDLDMLEYAYSQLKREAASGVGILGKLPSFTVHHRYGLLSCMQVAAYNLHLGLLRPEPFRLNTAKSTRSVVRPTSL